ncbi:phosphotransferase [Actinomyces sp. B33]|uniref:phosphotransferase n=1 Tax=Actinomyces sp. B33 TaxID=2942131 RepID=UPI0023425A54|nr:phosphotransferase [Actinomyces sp. B33]MDC4233796.1 phosphotransferase [Actinomyces sp. B33]
MTRAKTPLELAALATAAVPGLQIAGLRPPQYSDEVVSVTGIIDIAGNRWTVTCPHDSVGGLDLDSESGVLERLAAAFDAKRLPFDVPRVKGTARTPEGARVIVHQSLGGRTMDEADFSDPHLLPVSLARSLAALHNLPDTAYTGVDLPSYSAAQCRERQLALLDEAAGQVLIPANLWNRWEAALEDLSLWRFPAAPIHGDLQMTSVMVERGSVTALTGFSSAHVGDPATDVAWVLAQASDDFLDRFLEAYSRERQAVDLQLVTRAQLVSELAVIRWLVHGLHAEDRSIVAEAREMLAELSQDLGDDQLVVRRDPVAPSPEPTRPPAAPDSGRSTGPDRAGLGVPSDAGERGADAEGPTEVLDLGGRSGSSH